MDILDEFHLIEEIEEMVENVDMEPRSLRSFIATYDNWHIYKYIYECVGL